MAPNGVDLQSAARLGIVHEDKRGYFDPGQAWRRLD
jgi:hypothetical protein